MGAGDLSQDRHADAQKAVPGAVFAGAGLEEFS
jgi:hypothetical protein